ncbi:hypothetical protein EMIHUDRAFT_209811 [Emiliania huxleyi CCMP1516]|uniref:N-acetyltransferase ESCO zinc-finger domain-containing protein n=2 Tax=Emiliania huxleyi TaxID=2903 RepID=A0A0D3J2T8_EMIH1|nr:hypothetical protein EMIHUDRAFT_209811 [Emiliania huxleyi CCMP1516]EOD17823.1 hypothetical protein EMIHUDRAFT_209811 [Emiliania huxleyi CCMP1516]|eukprot:XP_005770252.1 hypothetical protein EMIHUDRAFT_209811 [Emiliania huxleyi CCMP1516]
MQLYLDFGQRSFGRQITCPECGLMYTEGEPNDEAGHRAHHERALRGAPMRECESESVACRLPDGSRICVVDVASAEPQLRRAREAATLMARDFGEFEHMALAFEVGREAGCALAASYVGEERLLVYASAEDASRDASDSATGKT